MQVETCFEERVRLESKLRQVFEEELKQLSEDFQWMLVDDLVTAFFNRLALLEKV